MGHIIIPRCDCIKTPEQFRIGLGIKDFARTRQNELAYCSNCREFRLMGESDVCECGKKLEKVYGMDMVWDDITDVVCPRCGGRLHIDIGGLWD